MALRVISIITAAMVTICVRAAFADDSSLQSSLFENCERAHELFGKLTTEEKISSTAYLTRVIGLSTQAPTAPEVFAIPQTGKFAEPNPAALWQNLDAKRELHAKRCALELLTEAGSLAFANIPALAVLYSEQPLSDEIAVGVEEATATIAELAHKEGRVPPDDAVDKLIPLLHKDRPLVVQNFLHEYLSSTLPRIVTYLGTVGDTEAQPIVSFLQEADPDSTRSFRAFLESTPQLSAEAIDNIAKHLPLPKKEGLSPFVQDLAKLASDQGQGPKILSLLAKTCLALGRILVEPEQSALLAANARLFDENIIASPEQRCLVGSLPALARAATKLLLSTDDSQIGLGLKLLPDAIKHLDPKERQATFARVKELSVINGLHQNDAIRSLPLFTEQRNEANTTIAQVLRESLKTKDVQEVTSTVDAAASSAAAINTAQKDLSRFTPSILEFVKRGGSATGVSELIAKTDGIESQVVPLLEKNTSVSSLGILTGLRSRKTLSQKTLTQIIESLGQPALSPSVESLLEAQGPSTAAPLRKAFLRGSASQRLGILSLLEVFGTTSPSEREELVNTLLASEGCGELQVRPRTIRSLLATSNLRDDLRTKLGAKAAACLCSFAEADAKTLLSTAGTTLLASPSCVENIVTNQTSCSHLEPTLASITSVGSVPEATRAHMMTQLIERATRAGRLQMLSLLTKEHPLAQQALPSVRALASAAKEDKELAYVAVLTLARLGDTQFDWARFVRDTIVMPESNPHYDTSLQIVRALPADIVLSEVNVALEADDPDRVAGACRVGATLGPLAIPIVSKVWNLRDRRSPAVRYAATLALLEINPLTPDLHQGVKGLLVNRYFTVAYRRPIQWRQSVAVADLDKANFGTLRTVRLERLLLK